MEISQRQVQTQTLTTEQRLQQRQVTIQQTMLSHQLEMNRSEIEDEVRKELDDNPALETAESSNSDDMAATDEDGKAYTETAEEMQRNDYSSDEDNPQAGNLSGYSSMRSYRNSGSSSDDEPYTPDLVSEESLIDHLTTQLHEQELTPRQEVIANAIIGELDSNGWLCTTTREIADDLTFYSDLGNVSTEEVEQVLAMVQQLDPAGVGCRTLRECILIQLKRRPTTLETRNAIEIVDKHFDDFLHGQGARICKAMSLTPEELAHIIKRQIRTTDPRPAAGYASSRSDHSQQITPDFEITIDDDEMQLTLLNNIPELQISRSYSDILEKYNQQRPVTRHDRDERKSINDQYIRAANFITVLKQRQEKLMAVMEAIMHRQREFFLTGDDNKLVPMILDDIAKVTGYDRSVISRAINNKYVHAPWGTRSLRSLFSEGVGKDGNEVSNIVIRNTVRDIINGEDSAHPLSDEDVRKLLKEKGYDVSRRTVAKYRAVLNIPSSRDRTAMHRDS